MVPAEKVVIDNWMKFLLFSVMKHGGELKCSIPEMAKMFTKDNSPDPMEHMHLICVGGDKETDDTITLKAITMGDLALLLKPSEGQPN